MVETPFSPQPQDNEIPRDDATISQLNPDAARKISGVINRADLGLEKPESKENIERILSDNVYLAEQLALGLHPKTRRHRMITRVQAITGRKLLMDFIQREHNRRGLPVAELSRNFWPKEVCRYIRKKIYKPNKNNRMVPQELLMQKEIGDPKLNGQDGNFLLRMAFNPSYLRKKTLKQRPDYEGQITDVYETSPLKTSLYLVWQQLNIMYNYRRNPQDHKDIYKHDSVDRVAVSLPEQSHYFFVLRMNTREKKIAVPKKGIDDFNTFIFFIFESLKSERGWQPVSKKKSPTIDAAIAGKIKRQELQDKIENMNDLSAGDFVINLLPEETITNLQNTRGEDDLVYSTNGPSFLNVFNLGFNESNEFCRASVVTHHPSTDASPLQLELQKAAQQLLVEISNGELLAADEKDPKLRLSSREQTTTPESEALLDVELDVTDLFRLTEVFYDPIRKRKDWKLKLPTEDGEEKEYGAEIPTYVTLMLAVMQTLGLEVGHNLIYEPQTGSLVPNALTYGKHIQKKIFNWDNKNTSKANLKQLRKEFLSCMIASTVDRKSIKGDGETPGGGVVRYMAAATEVLKRELLTGLGRIGSNRIRRVSMDAILFSFLGQTRYHDFFEPGANGENPAFYFDAFTTTINSTEEKGGVGIIAYKNEEGRIKVRITVRKGPKFPKGYKGSSEDFAKEVNENIEKFLKFFIEHLLPESRKHEPENIIEPPTLHRYDIVHHSQQQQSNS